MLKSRTHKLSKSISVNLIDLKKLAEYYRFKETFESMLQDLLVSRTSNNHWQDHLFVEEDLTYKNAMKSPSIRVGRLTSERSAGIT